MTATISMQKNDDTKVATLALEERERFPPEHAERGHFLVI